jgi:RNA polymerase sigma factor (sigma-70 family)
MNEAEASHEAWIRGALARFEGPLIAYAARITGDRESAREVVQDTFLRLCKARRSALEDRLAAWLYTVCRNRALDVRRKDGRMLTMPDGVEAAIPSPAPGPDEVAARNETSDRVGRVLATLPPRQQEMFRLKFADGLSYREIGEVTGCSVALVHKEMHRALAALRAHLDHSPTVSPMEGMKS